MELMILMALQNKLLTLLRQSLSLQYNSNISYLSVNRIGIYDFKANNGRVSFPTQFCLGSISNRFEFLEAEEVSLKGNMYDFSADYDAIDKSDILNIHNYLIVKNNIK